MASGMQGKDQADSKPPPAGRLQAIMDTILGNLQVAVSNIHIRYEVGSLYPVCGGLCSKDCTCALSSMLQCKQFMVCSWRARAASLVRMLLPD